MRVRMGNRLDPIRKPPSFLAGVVAGGVCAFVFLSATSLHTASVDGHAAATFPNDYETNVPVDAPVKMEADAAVLTSVESRRVLKPDFCRTSSTGYEILLDSFLGGIFREDGFLPGGSILDVGAQFGEMACHFAILAPQRTVHALDPSPSQCQQISKFAKSLPNLRVTNAGIGSDVGTGRAGPGFTGLKLGDEFRIETLDNLFFDKGETLGFAHIDVEGRELDVLKGGNKTIEAYKPIFTTELRVHQNPDYSRALLDYINELGYDTYVVDEPCGWPHMDYRNLMNFPRSMSNRLVFSDTFNLALATQAIFRVNSKSIFKKVYPCCALGGDCCKVNSTDDPKCCHEHTLRQWHKNSGVTKPMIMQGFTYSKRVLLNWWKETQDRALLSNAQAAAT